MKFLTRSNLNSTFYYNGPHQLKHREASFTEKNIGRTYKAELTDRHNDYRVYEYKNNKLLTIYIYKTP